VDEEEAVQTDSKRARKRTSRKNLNNELLSEPGFTGLEDCRDYESIIVILKS